MSTVRFGELIAIAREDLAAAGRIEGELRGESVVEAARAAGRITRTLWRYVGDVAPYGVVEAMVNPELDERVRAVVDARQALRAAGAALRRAVPESGTGPGPTGGGDAPDGSVGEADVGVTVERLRAAGAALAAGRDLLRTHSGTGADGERVDRSDWAGVIRSAPVARAVLAEVGRWSGELALLCARLSLAVPADGPVSPAAQQGLIGACHWLLTASGSLGTALRADPALPADMRLLEAVPLNHLPVRRPPADGESPGVLADGIAVSAARLATITRATQGRAAWSPGMTADSWRWTAAAAAAICQMSERALHVLVGHPGLGTRLPGVGAELTEAAERIGRASERWRDVARAWQSVSTEGKGLTGPGLTDTSDLALRLGRIIFRDSAWTPARKDSVALPGAAELATDADGFAALIGAVHHAVGALAHIAAADRDSVALAIRASRLHVPTRTLPAWRNVPYRFGNVLPATNAALRDAYDRACEMTVRVVAAMDTLAVAVDAPSRVLADARTAARSPANGLRALGEVAQSGGPETRAEHALRSEADAPRGPVEEAVRALHPADPSLLLRAQAVDRAASEVICQAQDTQPRGPMSAAGQMAVEGSAQVADCSFPAPGYPRFSVPVGAGSWQHVASVPSAASSQMARQRRYRSEEASGSPAR